MERTAHRAERQQQTARFVSPFFFAYYYYFKN